MRFLRSGVPELAIYIVLCASQSYAQSYSATYLPSSAPEHTEEGQTGTNQCGSGSDPGSMCQNAFVNSVDDFCLYAPPEPGSASTIGNTERIEVAWCIKSGYGTRLIPDGTITGAYFVETPDYVQITGVGDLTQLNIPAGDGGGELDPHGADGNGNPIGGLVFSSVFGGEIAQLHEWTNFMSSTIFCLRACKEGSNAPTLCQHIYDVLGCYWNMPGAYDPGTFVRCAGDSGEPMGVYGTSTFYQGDPTTPPAHTAPATSSCTTFSTIGNGGAVTAAPTTAPATMTTTPEASTAPPASSTAEASSTAGPSSTAGGAGSALPSATTTNAQSTTSVLASSISPPSLTSSLTSAPPSTFTSSGAVIVSNSTGSSTRLVAPPASSAPSSSAGTSSPAKVLHATEIWWGVVVGIALIALL